jgi:hypothetical protein
MRSTGFLLKFLTSLGHLHPVVIDCSVVYEFSDTKSVYQNSLPLYDWQEAQSFREAREQALVALFGLPSLLDRVIGGSQCKFAPSKAYRAMFAILSTDTMLRLAPTSFHPASPLTETETFSSYAKDPQVSVSMFRDNQHKFSEALRDVMRLARLVWFKSERLVPITLLLSQFPVSRERKKNSESGMRLVHMWDQGTGLDWTKTAVELESGSDQTDSNS